MKIRNTVILFGVFAAALLTFAAFQWMGVQTGEESKHAERYVFPTLNPIVAKQQGPQDQVVDPLAPPKKIIGPQLAKPEEFTRLVIQRFQNDPKKAEKLEFNRVTVGKGYKWMLVSPAKVRTDDAAVTNLIRTLLTLEKQKNRESSRDLAALGLDKPDTTVTLTRDNKEYTLQLGNTGPATKDPIYYASSSEWPGKTFLLTKSKFDKVFDELNNFRDKALVTSSFGHTGVKLAGVSRPTIELSKDKDWTFKEPAIGDADLAATDELTRQLSGIKVERNDDFVTDDADEAKLASYGLADGKAAYSFTITQGAVNPADPTVVETVLIGNADPTAARQAEITKTAGLVLDALKFSPTAIAAYLMRDKQKVEPTYYYARLAGDKTVVRIPARYLVWLKKQADELRTKALAKVDNSKIDAAYIKTPTEALRIYRSDMTGAASWDLYTDGRTKVKAQPQAFQALLDAVSKIEVRDVKAFLDDDAKLKEWFGTSPIDLGLDKPQAELSFWQEGVLRDKDGKPEGTGEPKVREDKRGKPSLRLVIGKKDPQRNVVYVRREIPGQKTITLAVPDPFISGQAAGAMQAGAVPPDGRQTLSLSNLATQGYLTYRDRSLPSYRTDQIASMEVKRAWAPPYTTERVDAKDEAGNLIPTWMLKAPVAGATNMGVAEFIANMLTGTTTDKLITDKATPQELADTYGLTKDPTLQIVVKTNADKPKAGETPAKDAPKPYGGGTYTYTIGKKVADAAKYPQHYYARVEATLGDGTVSDCNQFVFAVPLSYLQSLDLELRNAFVFPEDKTKPQSMTLTWNSETADKKPLKTELELALNGDKWEVKKLTENGTDAKAKLANLDQALVNALLRYGPQPAPYGPSLNPLQAERFWQHTGDVSPALKLKPTDAKLTIDVKYTDGKTRNLVIGETFKPTEAQLPAWTQATFYYASTPSVPGSVVLLNEAIWKDLAAGVNYFAVKEKPKQ
jgi:hypothetical protein